MTEGAAPLLEQPRKFTLLCILRQLGSAGIPEALPFLRRALRSADRHIRLAAARSIGRYEHPNVEQDLKALLKDPSHEVRAAAAQALLARSPGPAPTNLMGHQWIGQEDRDWASVYRAGEAARAILELACEGDDPVVRREAARALRLLDFRVRVNLASLRGVRRFRPLRLLSRALGH